MSIVITGLNNLNGVLRRIEVRAKSGEITRPAVVANGERMMTKAKKYTPVDTGHLRSTGNVQAPQGGQKVTLDLTFDADYAIYVHENLNARHTNGQAKFLERAVNEGMGRLQKDVARLLKQAVEGKR